MNKSKKPIDLAQGHAAMKIFLTLAMLCASTAAHAAGADDLGGLSIEELSDLEVTSVFKRPQPLGQSPASVYVITQEEIRRSGAVSLPEVLRLAPNLQVARLDAASYAISSRGFNTYEAAVKLLVLVDGRSVYTPLHAGVYWDQQQLMLNDIERIEVISGPGGTLWGSNAVNGVINVITRSAQQTRGSLASIRGGNIDRSASGRFGGGMGENGAFRVYAFGFERGDTVGADGISSNDSWRGMQTGFRTDWHETTSSLVVQGDLFKNRFDAGDIRGGNILSRWTSQINDRSEIQIQAYYDKVDRDVAQVLDTLETFDVALQHSLSIGTRQELVWGAGYRVTQDEFINNANFFALAPESETVQLSNLFVQDTIATGGNTTLTVGSKFEYSTFSGVEALPSVRLAWQASDSAMLWSAVSRAVRTPSRLDQGLMAPGLLEQANEFDSEIVIAYELGYRGQFSQAANLSISLFYNDYDRLRMLTITPNGLFRLDNAMEGYTYGVELWSDYQVLGWWRLSVGLNALEKRLELAPNAIAPALSQHAGNDPRRQYFLRSSMDLPRNFEFDLDFRAVDDLPNPAVPSYVELDARLGWHVSEHLQVSIAGFNLLNDHHPETGAAAGRKEIRRSGHFEVTWQVR